MASKSSRYRQDRPKMVPGRLQKWSEDAAVPFRFCVVGCTRHFEQKLKRCWTGCQQKWDRRGRKSRRSVVRHSFNRNGTDVAENQCEVFSTIAGWARAVQKQYCGAKAKPQILNRLLDICMRSALLTATMGNFCSNSAGQANRCSLMTRTEEHIQQPPQVGWVGGKQCKLAQALRYV